MPASQDTAAVDDETPGWIRRLGAQVWVHRRNVLISFAAAVLGSTSQAVVPLVARKIVDDVIGHDGAPLWPWLLLLVGIAVATFAFAYLRRYRGGLVGIGVQYDLRNRMHDHLVTLDEQSISHLSTGQIVARANSDTALVQGLLNFLPLMTGNLLMMVVSLAIMLVLSPLLALVGLVIAPALFVVSYRMRLKVFPATWDGQQREGEVAEVVDEDVNGVRVVKAFGQEERELHRMVGIVSTLYGVRMRATRLQARYQPLLESIPVLAQVAVLALGGWMALHGRISIGTFLAFSTYVGQFVAPARQLAGVLTVGQQARAGVERIFQLLDLTPAIADAPDAVDLPELRGEVELRGVRFGYGDEEGRHLVLDGLDLRVAAGERVALVGASGSGKSTVTRLVNRLLDPDEGQVLVDGVDVRTVTLHSLRGQVGAAFEESFLFSDSIAANIAFGRPDASREEVEEAARVAGAHQFVLELADGYDTRVGERGLSLSGGQRQRVALARAILSDPRILVLDDATSAVDASTEEQIFARLRQVLAGRTALIVAHRLSTLSLADRVVLLADGRVSDHGTHNELMSRSPLYRELLTGLDDDAASAVGDSIETLSQLDVTPSAWQGSTGDRAEAVRDAGERATARMASRPNLGAGLGGGGSWRLNLAPTPDLLARVAALPPVRDHFEADLTIETRPDPHFSMWRLVKEFRWWFGAGLALVVLDALAGLAGPYLVRIGVDHGVAAGTGHVLWWASAAFLLVALADLLDQVAATFVTGRTSERVMAGLRIRIWAQLQRLSLDYYEREMAGRIMTRMTTDVDQFETLIENGLLQALVSLVTFVGVGVALLLMDTELALWTLTVVVPLAAATVVFRRFTNHLYDVVREALAVVNADFQESLSGIREAQAFVHEGLTSQRFHGLGRVYYDGRAKAQRTIATYFPFVLFLSSIADVIVLGVGAHLIEQGRLSTGVLIAFLLYLTMFFSPIQQLSQVFDSWQQTRVSIGRISELMRLTTITPDATDPVALGPVRGELALRDVHFSYPSAEVADDERGPADQVPTGPAAVRRRPPEALRGLDLHVAAHETVALVGETGAGKSTVLKLIARFYDPDSGSVTLDGHDLRTLSLAGFRSRLGYVPQESFLFTGTIRDNIAYGRPDADDAEVEAAARAVGAHDLVAGLPGGYLHQISERGASLSAGQRQLIALARAELVDPAVLLLDEATANLDLATEARVSAAMAAVAGRRTTILIAHRLQTARSADRIVVVGQGRVLEQGTHDDLLAGDGKYAAMWRAFELVSAS
ncbi:MAG TPA: ABC transporter ATP-binding protein [Nocardioides sp.]|jgi:ATP-binding cassette subfamily B protein|uniref:ABC transporter ATP-binding protein n=1 Tax=Nocardioides sp. TaxID=35761 RepID=UPI002E32A25A|nr:ABC transporter ATP-binding protein [Nocardioides sp.]HEX3932709.1 ABC transporter ATP-binding protein [Nocardioides sp.]